MKDLAAKIAAVQQAEAECARQRSDAHDAWHHLQDEIKRTATPGRIVVSGLALGFASGFTTSGGAASAGGKFLTGPLFTLILESVVPGVLAGITAASTASAEIEEAAEVAVEDAVEQAVDSAPAEDAEAPAPAKPRRKGARRGRAQA